MPAAVVLAIQGLQALLTEFPQVEGLAEDVKTFVSSLVTKGVISADTQNQVHAHVDAVMAAIAAGTEPPEFTVEPDPTA